MPSSDGLVSAKSPLRSECSDPMGLGSSSPRSAHCRRRPPSSPGCIDRWHFVETSPPCLAQVQTPLWAQTLQSCCPWTPTTTGQGVRSSLTHKSAQKQIEHSTRFSPAPAHDTETSCSSSGLCPYSGVRSHGSGARSRTRMKGPGGVSSRETAKRSQECRGTHDRFILHRPC
jgi:hypothetical protein